MDRSYRQYCPVAHALDVIGDRWALLIVRDLFLGPKRFTDLREGLPGIGTNILTDRLKGLERSGIIGRRTLPPPAASAVYELSAAGRELEETVVALARWGGRSLGSRRSDQSLSTESVMLALRAAFAAAAERGSSATYEVRFAEPSFDATFGVLVAERGVDVTRGPAIDPESVLLTDAETLYAVANGRESWRGAVGRGAVRLPNSDAPPASILRRLDGVGD